MKKIAISASLLLLGAFLLLYVNINSLLPSLKGELEAHASQAFGVPVRLRSVAPSFFPSIKLTVKGIDVGEGKAGAIYLNEAEVSLNILPLLWRQLSVKEVVLIEPTLTLVRDGRGIRALRRKIPPVGGPIPPVEPLTLDSIIIRRGTITYNDDLKRTSSSVGVDAVAQLHREGTQYEITTEATLKLGEAEPITLSLKRVTFDIEPGTIDGDINVGTSGGDTLVKLALAQGFSEGDVRLATAKLEVQRLLPLIKKLGGVEPLKELKGRIEGDATLTLTATPGAQTLTSGQFTLSGGEVEWGDTRVRELYSRVRLSNSTSGAEALFDTLTGKLIVNTPYVEIAFKAPNTVMSLRSAEVTVSEGVATVNGDEVIFSGEIEPKAGHVEYDAKAARISNATLLALVPPLSALNPQGAYSLNVRGDIDTKGGWSVYGDVGLSEGGVTIKDQKLSSMNGVLRVGGRDGKISVDSKDLTLLFGDTPISLRGRSICTQDVVKPLSLDLSLLGGRAKISGGTDLKSKQFDLNASLQKIPLDELLSLLNLPKVPLKGTISKLEGSFEGRIDPSLGETLKGPVKLELLQTDLLGVNITREVLEKMKSLPLFEGRMRSHLPSEYRAIIAAPTTRIDSLSGRATIEQEKARIDDIQVKSNLFSLKGSGEVSLSDGSLTLHSTLSFSRAFSEALFSSRPTESELNLTLKLSKIPHSDEEVNDKWLVEVAGQERSMENDAAANIIDTSPP